MTTTDLTMTTAIIHADGPTMVYRPDATPVADAQLRRSLAKGPPDAVLDMARECLVLVARVAP